MESETIFPIFYKDANEHKFNIKAQKPFNTLYVKMTFQREKFLQNSFGMTTGRQNYYPLPSRSFNHYKITISFRTQS